MNPSSRPKIPRISQSQDMAEMMKKIDSLVNEHISDISNLDDLEQCPMPIPEYVNAKSKNAPPWQYSNKGFEIHLVQQINLLAFEPSFRSFKEAIIGVLDHLVDTVLTIERLETKLYIDYQQEVTFLKPTIAEEIIWNYKIQINALMDEQRIGPELRVQDFDKYMPLINGEDKIRIEKFLASPHTLDEFLELIQHFKTIADELPIINEHVISMGMYVMNRNELIGALVQAAENFRDVLVAKCTEDYLSLCKRLVRI
ncbi:hypothetical protein HHI36_004830 [Cryptolaemus montrouzieri]|uniref:Uncharacterized protein n=1 Tax=Cryptolaemus montrouzieri TaxID=559131 RepID=A0ABD2NSM3_9CUCU